MDKAVVVLAGEWECSGGGAWNFSQCIMVDDGITYEQLKSVIEREFAEQMAGVVGRMSYCLPTQMSMFSSAATPPVSISSTDGLKTFMKVRERTRGLNLFVTFEAPDDTLGKMKGGREEEHITKL